ncbi:hypothetical protein ACIFSR_07460 [Paenibacillus sp. NRS-1760]
MRLHKEFQGLSYDLLVSHTTIVFFRYFLLALQHRQANARRFILFVDQRGRVAGKQEAFQTN